MSEAINDDKTDGKSELARIVGERIKNYRKQQGLSQEELAFKASPHPTYIGQLERGEKNATLESVEKVATALGVTLEELFRFLQPDLQKKDNLVLSNIFSALQSRSNEDLKTMLSVIENLLNWKDS